ncbi:hypothetical protein AUK04_01635 [Candidatus Roizmanbacteria bacterium CG2_30_33_16]|uniref:AAA+ ATPase domain-containing protein n=4 Tax=Candidatus Roizmaniibacteriota TaxID=1752723 RepID=A0A2H0C2G9_9BACT|nr:ATP-binding protein [Candidatus Roizmanbacteria bacterium]OIP85090.1 MAG: hypothetical protein AUK04_01635 [Candidatus Roizmanbacteria bacterium CG2_30_33_16]PIP64115.1 MAG: hypothetical protein COW96_04350 [Candidatus Roizmanbacteria bacterium CG22_combo_CG10-13_8_21_14_all_33_16]PIX71274.1 MAG: hypothetical protein COZ39_03765 [Candidatus Roizmanbacteria bacterium CG_4_10_14_3_um_filter_33_21]PJB88084.1 MAG: hypothetical protein CO083_03625 [Candidatus Roizmanbacteria bacterium CG_4_9_14_0
MDNQKIEPLLRLNQQAKEKGRVYLKKRYLFDRLLMEKNKNTIIGISGLRGSGKTILLCQLLNQLSSSFYLSGDSIDNINLYELADFLIKNYRIKNLLIDEIHYLKDWSRQLKLISDFLKVKVYFTSSISLNILSLKSDLSRRVKIIDLPIFSLREYLDFKFSQRLSPLKFQDIIKNYKKLFQKFYQQEAYFNDYLSQPLPFMLDDPSHQLVKQVAEKIIEKDLFCYSNLTRIDIEAMKNIINFIANTPISDINYSVLSKNIAITKYKAKQYVDYLEKGYLLKSIFPFSSSVIKEPKIVLTLPFRQVFNYRLTDEQLRGALREEFFTQSIGYLNQPLYYLKSKRGAKTPDYLFIFNGNKYIFEIGGQKKGFSQFKGISDQYKKYLVVYPGVSQNNKIPLILFGLLS